VAEAIAAGDAERYRHECLILADHIAENHPDAALAEREAARRRRKGELRRSPGVRWPRAGVLPAITPHQAEQLRHALARPFGLLTGTPGTGKTFAAAAVITAVAQSHGLDAIAVAAPTGKAAVRISDALRRYGVPIQARTIHSLLEIGRNGHDGEGWGFMRNAKRPLDQRFLFVDEASMLDADLAASLFDALAIGTHVLLIGDPHQLPPVGHGAPLRDLIAAGAPCGKLSEIKRQGSDANLIVKACAAIKDGKDFEVCVRYSPSTGENLRHIEAAEPEHQFAILREVLDRFRRTEQFDPLWGVQILTATNKGSPLARRELNRMLQAHLNPTGAACPPNPFHVSDKLICLRNGWHALDDRGQAGEEVYLANGEIGQVVGVEPKRTVALFTNPDRLIRIPMGKPRPEDEEGEAEGGTGCDFDLAYAITCHKSQGSEWPCVIVLADASPGARRVCSREWLYTAISRAGQLCLTIGRNGVLQQMGKRPTLTKRKTFLRELMTNG
jgi:exodeoxyribonuclease V alpha subunit